MTRAVALLIALMFLDALTTYVIIEFGVGREANMFLQFINEEPELIFAVQAAGAMFAWFISRFAVFKYVVCGLVIARGIVVLNNVHVLLAARDILYIAMPASAVAVVISIVYTAYVLLRHRHEFRDIKHVFTSFT